MPIIKTLTRYKDLLAGAGITIVETVRDITISSSGTAVADDNYGDITVTGGGGSWAINNGAVTDAKLGTGITASKISEDSSHRFATDAEKTAWDAKQSALVSGTNIKTINGSSLLGSGDLPISGGSSATAWGKVFLMITLSASDYLSADTSASSVLTYTIFGMELNSGTEVYKVLAQGQVASAIATIYTVPSSTTAFIRSMSFVNNDTVVRTLELTRGGTTSANRIIPILEIPAGGMAIYEDGMGWSIYTSNGIMLSGANPLSLVESAFFVAGCKAETFNRKLVTETNTALLSTGRLSLESIAIRAGEVLTSISFWSATTAAGTPTNQLFGLYNNNFNLLRSTTNDTTTAWTANTRKTLNLTSTFTTTYSGLYYLGIMVTATTVPTVKGVTAITGGQLKGATPILGGTSNTGLTTALPNPCNTPVVATTSVWWVA